MQDEGLKDLNLIIQGGRSRFRRSRKGHAREGQERRGETKIILSGVGAMYQGGRRSCRGRGSDRRGFNVKPEARRRKEAEKRKVEIRTYTIIYELIEDIEAAVKGMLEPKFEESIWELSRSAFGSSSRKKGIIAGCYVTEGKVTRNAECRVERGRDLVYDGQDRLAEAPQGRRSRSHDGHGVRHHLRQLDDFKEGDVVEAFEMVQINL